MNSVRPPAIAFLALFLCIGSYGQDSEIQQISAKLTTNLTSEGRKSVAVVDFTDLSGCVTELGRYVAEELSTDLASQHTSFQVVDRTSLQVIMQENKLATTGVIDPSVARRLGQIAGVDTLISGTLTPLGDTAHLSVKALDATTARIIIADQGEIPRTGAVNELLARGMGCSGSMPAASTHAQGPSGNQKEQNIVHPSMEVQGILAVADSCVADGQVLTCTVTLTSHQQDANITFGAGARSSGRWVHSEAYDDSGVEYGSDSITFARRTSYPYAETSGLLVADTPTHLVMKFNQFNSASVKVTLLSFLLEVRPSGGGYRQSNFNLRNITIQK
jgi:TolB-like protein